VAYLLDTNALVWLANGSAEIGRRTAALLEKQPVVYFTPLSIAELKIKEFIGRLSLPKDFLEQLTSEGLTSLDFETKHAWDVGRFESLIKHDPFDRLILAQAATSKLKLITSDEKLLGLGFDWVLNARD